LIIQPRIRKEAEEEKFAAQQQAAKEAKNELSVLAMP
jgi:hypothetical protein